MRFLCDAMLGKLAKYLRVFGLDAVYVKNYRDFRSYRPHDEPHLFFTRRTSLRSHEHVVFIQSDRPMDQLKEVWPLINPYIDLQNAMTRCLICNSPLADVPKKDVEQLVPEFIFHRYETFRVCPACRKIYWAGSHAANMAKFIEEISCGHPVE